MARWKKQHFFRTVVHSIDLNQTPPLPSARAGECNYGGRVTDDKDRRLLLSLLSIFYNWELIQREEYQLCEGDMYYVPAHGPHKVKEGVRLFALKAIN